MFDAWLEQEKKEIRSRYQVLQIVSVLLVVLMAPSMLLPFIFFLDSPGVSAFLIIPDIFVIGFILYITSYKRRFIKPLLASVQQELTTKAAQEEFARQMQEQAEHISYQPHPQWKACEIMVAEEYCYMRQPGKSRIIQNRQLRRIVFKKEEYIVGRGHVRWCYTLALYASDDEKPVWKGYFREPEKAVWAFQMFQRILPPEVLVQDEIANPQKGPKKPLWKNLLEFLLYIAIISAMIFMVRALDK